MKVRSGVLLLFFALKNCVWCNVWSNEDIRIEQFLMPLVYLRNFNNNDIALQVPLMYVPVVILPLNLDKIRNSPVIEIKDNNIKINETKNVQKEPPIQNESENDDIEVNFRQSLNRGAKIPKKTEAKAEDDLNQNFNNSNNNTDSVANNTDEVNTTSIEDQGNTTEVQNANEIQITTNNSIEYSASRYDNKLLDSLSLTILNEETKLPAIEDKRWKNFTLNANININKTSTSDNLTPPKRAANSSKSPYSVALYNNAMIDQLSITTNSYTNLESSTAQNDRSTFSSLGGTALKSTGFKPLAGLYYDGFLHTPLIKMPGFNPHGDYNYP